MSIETLFIHDLKIVFTTAHGKLELEEVLDYQKSVWSGPAHEGYSHLFNASDADLEKITIADLKNIFEISRRDGGVIPTKLAVVTSSMYVRQLTDYYRMAHENTGKAERDIGLFDDPQLALNWISEKETAEID